MFQAVPKRSRCTIFMRRSLAMWPRTVCAATRREFCRELRRNLACASAVHAPTALSGAAKPLLLPPPASGGSAIELNPDCGLDLDAAHVPTISVIGPSRRGKSVLAGLLAGGDPRYFPQSHSSFRAMTSGTHVVEVPGGAPAGLPLRLIDTEGLSHIGRSRKSEAVVRQFLIGTYLTSSWVVWLDTEVLSTSFFNMMWLVHDYVVDVLRVKHSSGSRLPRLMYVRTQETDLQRREWEGEFDSFGDFFARILEVHEDAHILTQMFATQGIHGHSLPLWTVEDLEHFEASRFWAPDGHSSPFKAAVSTLRDKLLDPFADVAAIGVDSAKVPMGPPLLVMSQLQEQLPRIAKLEAFDPRDHEAAKVLRARNHLRASYGRLVDPQGDGTANDKAGTSAKNVDVVGLVNLFDTEDKDVRDSDFHIDQVVRRRFEKKCIEMRVEPAVAQADEEVKTVLAHFDAVADIFKAAVEAFEAPNGGFAEKDILEMAIVQWRLDPNTAKQALMDKLEVAEKEFLAASGLTVAGMRKLRIHERLRWRIDDCMMRLRGRIAAEVLLRETARSKATDVNGAALEQRSAVWRLGSWQRGAPPRDGKTVRARRPREYALWTDGQAWALYEETKAAAGETIGDVAVLSERGFLAEGSPNLPVPAL